MKRIILTVVLAAVAAVAANAQISVGIGYGQKNMSDGDHTLDIGGLYVNADYNLPIASDICVAPGIAFSYVTSSKNDDDFAMTYLDVPVNFNYAFPLADGFKLGVYAGPTLSLGVTGTASDGNIDLYKDLDYNRFDILVGGGIALDVMDMIRVSVGYNKGLLARIENSDVKIGGVHFGVAYLF